MVRDRDTNIKAATAVCVGMASIVAVLYHLRTKTAKDPVDDEQTTYIRLSKFEDAMVAPLPISMLTWFQGDHNEAAKYLKERLEQIVASNPWLGGKLMRHKGKLYIELAKQKEATLTRKLFIHASEVDSPIHRDLFVADLAKKCLQHSPPLLLEPFEEFKGPLLRVSVAPCSESPSTRFAVVVSLSHLVGDGHTFYHIHNMLLSDQPVQTLVVDRIPTTLEQQKQIMGEKESTLLTSSGVIISALRGMIMTKVISPFYKPFRGESRYFLVDTDKIARLKKSLGKASEDKVPFISTNDVISSWFISNSSCHHGFMAINLRNRIEGHRDHHAGNYENCIYYRSSQDASHPELIRQSLKSLRRARTRDEPVSNREIATNHFALVTNWASFHANSVELPGCKELIHLPLYDMSSSIPATMAVCTIFRARPNQLGINVTGTPAKMARLRSAPFESDIPFQ